MQIMKNKKIKNLLLFTSLFFISFCGGQEIVEETTELTTSTTTTIQETTTTSLVIQEIIENDCIPDDNTGTNTESKRK